MTPEEITAREAIRFTQSAYHLAGDRGRIDDLVATFTEDGVLQLAGGVYRGREAIADRLTSIGGPSDSRGRVFLHHHLTTSHVELIDERSARGWSYFLVMSPVGVDHSGRYADRYAAVGDRWLIADRKVVVSWAAVDSVIGADVP